MQSEPILSTPDAEGLATWRLFFESAYALIDVLDAELQASSGISLRWYDVLVHLEEAPEGLRMNELARRIVASKSGLTRVIDRMEEAGLVRRERSELDRRAIEVVATPAGRQALHTARPFHRDGLQRHFAAHLDEQDLRALALALALAKVHDEVRGIRASDLDGASGK